MEEKEIKSKRVLSDAEKIALYESDGICGIYFSLNFQLNELSRQVREADIDFENEESKVFERFMKVIVESKDTVENMLFIENKIKERYKVDDVDEAKGKSTPILEQFVKNKKDGK